MEVTFFYFSYINFSFSSAEDTIDNKPTLVSQLHVRYNSLLPLYHFWNLVSQAVKSYDKVDVCFGDVEDCIEALSNHSGAGESSSAGREQGLQHKGLQVQTLSQDFTSFTFKYVSSCCKRWVVFFFWTVALWHQFISIVRLPLSCLTVFIFH